MGVLNITPDSFSDGGLWLDPRCAVEHGLRMLDQGADLLDLGAESTRPGGGVYGAGAREVPAEEELTRLVPVVEGLRRATDAVLSVDTRKGSVAHRALVAGADLINDVGGLRDPQLAEVVAEAGCPVVVMHSRGELGTMQREICFAELTREVTEDLRDAGERARAAGIACEQLIFDPGIGFGKTGEQNIELLAELDRLHALGRPILVGASRKSFIAAVSSAPPRERLGGSLAAAAWAARWGAAIVRVHDVAETVQLLRVWNAIDSAREGLARVRPTGVRPLG
ncbi:MAG: dihydropteroate synthase [bacterium]|nr:dihydropteroate synthase [bacterium]